MSSSNTFSVHAMGLCESETVGLNTTVGAFTHVLPGAKIGDECNIYNNVLIENNVVIGNRVTLMSGVQIWDGIILEDDVVVGPNVSFTNGRFPRNDIDPTNISKTIIRNGASLGANATISSGLTIGQNAKIEAGSTVTRNVPANAIVVGNPAKIIGYVDAGADVNKHEITSSDNKNSTTLIRTTIKGVTKHLLPEITDIRGTLSVGEFEKTIPFKTQRYFLVYDVPTVETRGEHAHKKCHQFLIAIKGSIHVVADDGLNRQEFILDSPNVGIHLPPMVWGVQYRYSSDAVLLVFASEYYDNEDYIRNYDDFLDLVKAHNE